MFRKILLFLVLSLGSQWVLGQPGDPGGNPDAPITGIEILLAAGGLFGIRQLIKRKK